MCLYIEIFFKISYFFCKELKFVTLSTHVHNHMCKTCETEAEEEGGFTVLDLELMFPDTVKTKLFCFFPATLSIGVGVSGFLPVSCFEGFVENQCDRATWSVSVGVSARASRGEQQMETRKTSSRSTHWSVSLQKKTFYSYRSHWSLASIDPCRSSDIF